MDAPPIETLRAALVAVDEAVDRCVAVARITPEEVDDLERRRIADVAVDDYQAAEAVVETLMALYHHRRPPRTLATLDGAVSRAWERLSGIYGELLVARQEDFRPLERARYTAQVAYDRAMNRYAEGTLWVLREHGYGAEEARDAA